MLIFAPHLFELMSRKIYRDIRFIIMYHVRHKLINLRKASREPIDDIGN